MLELASTSVLRDAVEMSINDELWHWLLWEPRSVCVPSSAPHIGANTVRAFEGQYFDEASHAYRNVGCPPDASAEQRAGRPDDVDGTGWRT